MGKKRERGRPVLPAGQGKNKITGFRATPDERVAIEKAAAIAELNLSEWLRQRVLVAAQREIKRAEANEGK